MLQPIRSTGGDSIKSGARMAYSTTSTNAKTLSQ